MDLLAAASTSAAPIQLLTIALLILAGPAIVALVVVRGGSL